MPVSLESTDFRAALSAVLDDIRDEAVAAERTHRLLHERVRQVLGLGFGALRVPRERGGAGASFAEVIDVVIELAEADSNLAHVLRGHVVFAEMLGLEADAETRASRWDLWAPRFLAGELVGNAQSERGATADISTAITRDTDAEGRERVSLDGVKFYTTGSIYADWIYLVANDPDEPSGAGKSGVAVASSAPGVESVDDWDGVGQQLTGSGTTTFADVPLDGAEVLPVAGEDGFRARCIGALFQLYLLAVVAGIAQAIVRDTVAYVQPRRRLGGYSGEAAPRDDALVQSIVGDLASAAHTARVLVRASAADFDRALAARDAAETASAADAEAAAAAADRLALEAQLGVFKAQQVVLRTVLAEANELFEVGGATAVTRGAALDRHWRNVRTIASHNPAVQRRRAIGDYELNGTLPQRARPANPANPAPAAAAAVETAAAAR